MSAPVRCSDCRWVHEADSVKGTSFQGVELCPAHDVTPDMRALLRDVVKSLEYAVTVLRAPESSTLQENLNNTRAVLARLDGAA